MSEYIKSSHTCQVTGKPNQVIKPPPLHPIPASGKPFEHVECVGPLPPPRSGAKYLLIVMCQATRYPAAYPLWSIKTRLVVKALSHFMSIFGIPITHSEVKLFIPFVYSSVKTTSSETLCHQLITHKARGRCSISIRH